MSVTRVIDSPILKSELSAIAQGQFGDMVKAVVDISKEILAIGGEMHSDAEALLLQQGAHQEDLWGINLYVGDLGEDWIEFDSMINIRPARGNKSRGVEDPDLQKKIRDIVRKWVTET